MKNKYLLLVALMLTGVFVEAQNFRYVKDMFTDSDIVVESDLKYGTNIDFLTSKLNNPANIGRDLVAIKTAMATGQTIPANYYDPTDASSDLKVTDLKYDIYYPDGAKDSETNRPVVVYIHTGNFLPPCINGSPLGVKEDEVAKGLCMAMARKGYVAVSANYRLGWNPVSDLEPVRKGTLLNAVYRSIHDIKMCVRVLKAEGSGSNKYGIDPNKVILIGEGTGAYISNSYNTLDKHEEITYTRFLNPVDGKPYVDTLNVGNIEGFGGTLNLYAPNGQNGDISASIALGGALPDTAWLEAGDAPMMSFHCVRDPFAPFNSGLVIVPTTGESVVEVHGGNLFIEKANAIGNNDALKSATINDDMSAAARSRYGKTYDYIFPAPRNKMTVTADNENLFPVIIPLGGSIFQNTAQPWQYWDTAAPTSKCEVQPGVTADMASRQSNPNASPENGALWADTITGYICPRLANLFGFVGVDENELNSRVQIFPNPSTGVVNIRMEALRIDNVRVYDINGKLVDQMDGSKSSDMTVNLGHMKNGMYFIEIDANGGTAVKKLSIQ